MLESKKERLIRICEELIAEAAEVEATKFDTRSSMTTFVHMTELHTWWAKVKSFGHLLGTAARPWKSTFESEPEQNSLVFAMKIHGVLQAIRHELINDHLESFSELIRAETLADLLDQAEHLFRKGYFLAAGVLGRAVLEEHLRGLCTTLACKPPKKKPTLNDYNMALYGVAHYSKTRMKQIDALTSIGNEAAHNSPDLSQADVKKLLFDLPELIGATKCGSL